MMPPCLDDATTEELTAELARRFKAVLVIGMKDAKENNVEEDWMVEYHGGLTTAIGLVHRGRKVLMRASGGG